MNLIRRGRKMSDCVTALLVYSRRIGNGVLMMLLIFAQIGCANHASSDDFREVFTDFTFVGMGAYEPFRLPTHGIERKSIPSEIRNNRQYVFHHASNLDDNEIYEALRVRLKCSGFRIISSNLDDYWYIGGPGFHIHFEGRGYRGFIHNQIDGLILRDTDLIKKWNIDDYILVIESTRSSADSIHRLCCGAFTK